MLIDSHCHLDRLDLEPFNNDFSTLMDDTVNSGVNYLLCVCINLQDYPAMRRLVDPYPQVSVSVGVHPNEGRDKEASTGTLAQLAQDSRVVAIGETGLDYYREEADPSWQMESFRTHMAAALKVRLPLIVHTRAARVDTVKALREGNAGEVGGVLHCFSEDWETAKQCLDMNFHISFSGILTFRNAREIQDVARRVPEDRILIETDSPYLAPVPKRGKQNYPKYVRHVAECLAELRGTRFERIAEVTGQNFRTLFTRAGV